MKNKNKSQRFFSILSVIVISLLCVYPSIKSDLDHEPLIPHASQTSYSIDEILLPEQIFDPPIDSNTSWERIYIGHYPSIAQSIRQTMDGGYIITGAWIDEYEYSQKNVDLWVIKTYPNGTIQWDKKFQKGTRQTGSCVDLTDDGGYIIVGYHQTYGPYVWLLKLSANGTEEWSQSYRTANHNLGVYVRQTSDGGYIVLSQTYQSYWLLKTFANGTEDWQLKGAAGTFNSEATVHQTHDGGYIIGCNQLIKIAPNGTEEWSYVPTIENSEHWYGYAALQTSDKGYAYLGVTHLLDKPGPDYDTALVKMDVNRSVEWIGIYDGSGLSDTGVHFSQTHDDGFIFTGWSNSPQTDSADLWLVRTNKDGVALWEKTYGDKEFDIGYSVTQTNDNGFIVAGRKGYPNFHFAWVIKLPSDEHTNQPPIVDDIPDQTIIRRESFTQILLDEYVSDPENDDDTITWTVSGNEELFVEIDSNRIATITPPIPDWFGSETLTFTAEDPLGQSDSDDMVCTVKMGPVLEIDGITGGFFDIEATIRNVGDLNASEVPWTIQITEGRILPECRKTSGIIDIPAGEERTIVSRDIIGIGKANILVTAQNPVFENSKSKEETMLVLFFYIKVLSSNPDNQNLLFNYRRA